jgi:hypothetical protein
MNGSDLVARESLWPRRSGEAILSFRFEFIGSENQGLELYSDCNDLAE